MYNKFKIYRPYNKVNEKWLTNCTITDIQGYEQLPNSGDLLIITKSLKDVMTLYSLGYTAIAVNSENTLIPKIIMSDIKKRFKKIIVFFDNDKSGIDGATKFCKEFSIPNMQTPEGGAKDISDFIKAYNITKTLKFIKN